MKNRRKDPETGMKVALLILLITFIYLFGVTFWEMPESGIEQAKTIVPFLLGSVIGTLIGFYYGNKHEQQDIQPNKTETTTTTETTSETTEP